MSISIVMLTYNNYEKFLRAMTSMFYFITDDRIKEFIFLDNGSHEIELKKFLRQLDSQISKVRVIFSDKNLGIAKGRKVLYDTAEGDYIASFDSDIIIVNPGLFIEIFYRALEIPDMMMVGGGGGDHPYFPSLEKENIINQESPEGSTDLRVVDELAGWFHGFKSSILTKNGGKIEMDEQFSPFWAEDSDFCMQVKTLGGKCCIMGKGVVAHQWSSCDKQKTQITLEVMWNKFRDKWYNIFGEDFKFKIDEKFYEINYPLCKENLKREEYYFKVGMIEGHLYSKEPVKNLFQDVKFLNNTYLEYRGEKMKYQEFNGKYFLYDEIVKNNYKVITENLPKNIKNIVILTVFDINKAFKIIKNLISMQSVPIVLVVPFGTYVGDFILLFKKFATPFMISEFPNYHFDLIPYIISAKELMKKYRIENILNLSTKRDNSEFLTKPLTEFSPGYYLEKQVSKFDNYCLSFINQVLNVNSSMMWNSECIYYETTEYLSKLLDSFPVMDTLMKCLRIPKDYKIHISPRCSPRHSLERIIGYIKPIVNRIKNTYYTFICDINNKEDLDKISVNISYLLDGEVCVINTGDMKKISHKLLDYDYYFLADKDQDIKTLMLFSLSNIKLEDYTNFVFLNDSFEIVDTINDFLERAVYKNISFCKKNKEYDTSLFSLNLDSIMDFGNSIKEENFDLQDYLKKINTVSVWDSSLEENEDETILTYYKQGLDDGRDYPLI